ncbi:ATP/GTP-binding protein [uncultured Sphaerochaeta sp.]|uniref:AAA family ATPase n=1 Tax=uncultured Sphaerochaeta sp. TaxID=886478 RepID=UPI002D1E39F0|nr:ATP/GTP-binding protein [uncultured Sphaerochaeta sp.]
MFAGKSRAHQERVKDIGDKSILKMAALFGANASGKSNFIKALSFMDETVENGHLQPNNSRQYCRIDATNKVKKSYFEVVLLLDGSYYSYGFEAVLNLGHFTSEWLMELDGKGKETILFTRNLETGKTQFSPNFQKASKERLQVYADDMKANADALFLTAMNTNKVSLYKDFENLRIFKKIYEWFLHGFLASEAGAPVTSGPHYLIEEKLKQVSALLQHFDTDVTKIDSEYINFSDLSTDGLSGFLKRELAFFEEKAKKMLAVDKSAQGFATLLRTNNEFLCLSIEVGDENPKLKKVFFRHSAGEVFNLSEESDGTIRIMDLAEILLTEEEKVFVVDELDRCLHPQLSYEFIRLFLEQAAKYDIQLIFTTHESYLMDFDLLRRDEIWFTEKKEGISHLYSLEEFNERIDRKIDKAYLEGRYGGVPLFSTLFPMGKLK